MRFKCPVKKIFFSLLFCLFLSQSAFAWFSMSSGSAEEVTTISPHTGVVEVLLSKADGNLSKTLSEVSDEFLVSSKNGGLYLSQSELSELSVYLDEADDLIQTLKAVSEEKDREIEELEEKLSESTAKNIQYESKKVRAVLIGNAIIGWDGPTAVWGAQAGAGFTVGNWMLQAGLMYKDFSEWSTNHLAFFAGASYLF